MLYMFSLIGIHLMAYKNIQIHALIFSYYMIYWSNDVHDMYHRFDMSSSTHAEKPHDSHYD